MRKGIDPPHIVALTIVVCAAIAPAFMLWGRTIGEWAVGLYADYGSSAIAARPRFCYRQI